MSRKFCGTLRVIALIAMLILSHSIVFSQTNSLDNALADLAKQITDNVQEVGKKKVAVIEFSDLDGRITHFGKYLAEELITRLALTRKFEVIERQLLNKIISEQKLSLTGLIEPSSAKELGKILGVDAIVSGTITDLVSSLKVNARIISTETGAVFAVAATGIIKDEAVRKLMEKTGSQPEEPLPPEEPVKPSGEIVYVSDLEPSRSQGGVQRNTFANNNKIIIGNKFFNKGLDTHAPALLSYNLNGKYRVFESYIGLWDSENPMRGLQGNFAGKEGSVVYVVWVDGKEKFRSEVMRWNDTKKISIPVQGAMRMDLQVEDGGDGNNHDWAVWGDAMLIK